MSRLMRTLLLLSLLLLPGFSSQTARAQGLIRPPAADRARLAESLGKTLKGGAPGEAQRLQTTPDGFVRYLGAPTAGYYETGAAKGATAEAAARAFLKQWGNLFVSSSAQVDYKLARQADGAGRSYVHLGQTWRGLPIYGAEVAVQLNAKGGVESVLSDQMQDTGLLDLGLIKATPTLSADAAKQKALTLLAASHPGVALAAAAPQLMIYDPPVIGSTGQTQLVWKTAVTGAAAVPVDELVLVNAETGKIALHFTQITNALNRQIYDAANVEARDPGTLVRSEGGAASSVTDANNAYNIFSDAYNFFKTRHNRDGIDNRGHILSATVRFHPQGQSLPYINAFWSGGVQRFYFGEGLTNADDVIAHEYTHAVTQYTCGLIYFNQSGAINESLSDVFGELIDQTNGRGLDTAAVKWQVGEEEPHLGAIRDMKNPPAHNQPDRMGSTLWNSDPSANDNGGVHANSGVGNKLCYLLSDGGTFNGRTITGLGLEATEKLFYECQSHLLTRASDYYDLGSAMTQAAINLGYSATQKTNVDQALQAVEVKMTRVPLATALNSSLSFNSFAVYSYQGQYYLAAGNWFGQTTKTHDGSSAARSGFIQHAMSGEHEYSVLETTVTGPGTFSFWWSVSSESGYDKLMFVQDDTLLDTITGSVDWVQKTISVPAGSHTFQWQYMKDSSVSAGSDCGWVDQLTWSSASTPPALTVTPADTYGISGYVGGPFTPASRIYTVKNTGGAAMTWAVSKTPAWLTLSKTGGTLAGGASDTVTVSVNSTANALTPGSYSGTLTFTNGTNGVGNTTRAVAITASSAPGTLTVTPTTGLTASGTVGGPFSAMATYSLKNTGSATLGWTASKTQNWLAVNPASGSLVPGASLTVTVSIASTANSLAAGTYSDTVTFTNTTNGRGNTTRAVSLTVSSAPSAGVWTRATAAAPWEARDGHCLVVFNNKLWVLGGWGVGRLNDVWSSADGVTWTRATAAAAWSARDSHGVVVFNNKLYLMGGEDASSNFGDVWSSSDGATWTRLTASAPWGPRYSMSTLVFNNKIWVIGGYSASSRMNDVWNSSDGITWTRVTSAAAWAARGYPRGEVFGGKMWLMGGNSANGYANDVWSSADGVTWTQATAAAGWTGRTNFSSAVIDNKLWILGGYNGQTGATFNDVWYSTNGATWTRSTAAVPWVARDALRSVPFLNRLYMVGGFGTADYNDVWYLPFASGTPIIRISPTTLTFTK